MIFIDRVNLYNQQNEIIGNIYPRRAKQLVLSGRAVWLDEGRTLQLAPGIINASFDIKKEEVPMIDENMYPTNGERKDTDKALALKEPDSLLLYQAKLNVKEKKNTTINIAAYIAVWIVLAFLYDGAFAHRTHPDWRSYSHNFARLYEFAPEPDITNDSYWSFTVALDNIQYFFMHNYTSPMWYVILGVMLAWGCWIAARFMKHMAKPLIIKIRARFTKGVKPDPVIQEYNRLRSIADEEAM